jgi:hypothetical protein
MSIKFNCQHCKRSLKVSSELAGKKARCPGCKKVVVIPSLDPVPPPASVPQPAEADVEALAAAALVDQPKPEPVVAAKQAEPIKFTCFYCDEEIQVSADLAGKQTPCPECRRIVKVPMPVKTEPRDWRKPQPRGPAAGLRRDEQPAPEGAWGSATSASTVSQQALLEAEAIPMAEEQLTPFQWVVRGLVAAAGVLLVGVAVMAFLHLRDQNQQKKSLRLALSAVAEGANPAPSNLAAAEINRAAGEFYMREGKMESARTHFKQARTRLQAEQVSPKSVSDRDTLLIDLALSQIELGGSQEDELKGTRLEWKKTYEEIRQTVQKLVQPEARTEALRRIARKFIEKDQINLAESLAYQVVSGAAAETDRPEMLGIVGLELCRASRQQEAEALANKALDAYAPDKTRRPPIAPTLITLLVLVDQEKKAEQFLQVSRPRPDVTGPAFEVRLGYAQAWAWEGQWEAARQLASTSGAVADQFRALLAVALIAQEKNPAEVRSCLELTIALSEKELAGQPTDPWLLLQLVRRCARAGLAERASTIPERITDPGLQERAHLELVRVALAARSQADADALATEAQLPAPRPLILEALARHNARFGDGVAVRKSVDAWETETLRPYGYIGVALGLQDSGK